MSESYICIYNCLCCYCLHCISGDYQRLEYLGDAILQFLTSKFVYHHFPAHNEGHLSVSSHLEDFSLCFLASQIIFILSYFP